jgi:hypothetical protein
VTRTENYPKNDATRADLAPLIGNRMLTNHGEQWRQQRWNATDLFVSNSKYRNLLIYQSIDLMLAS